MQVYYQNGFNLMVDFDTRFQVYFRKDDEILMILSGIRDSSKIYNVMKGEFFYNTVLCDFAMRHFLKFCFLEGIDVIQISLGEQLKCFVENCIFYFPFCNYEREDGMYNCLFSKNWNYRFYPISIKEKEIYDVIFNQQFQDQTDADKHYIDYYVDGDTGFHEYITDEMFDRTTPIDHKLVLYRGLDDISEIEMELLNQRPVSASTSPELALAFSGRECCMVFFQIFPGVRCIPILQGVESEIVIDNRSVFNLVSTNQSIRYITQNDETMRTMELSVTTYVINVYEK